MKNFPSGLGGTTGNSLAIATALQCTGDVWYVNFATGTDGAGLGKQRLAPLKTLAQAVTNSADGDILCFLSGHAETLTAVQTIAKKLILVGEGTGIGSMPSFTRNVAANGKLIDVTTNRVHLRNLYFPVSSTADTGAKVAFSGTDGKIIDCYFAAGANDTGPQVDIVTGGDRCRIQGTTFISASITTQPSMGVRISNALADITMVGAIFDGGTKGWSNAYALDATAAVQTNIVLEDIQLLRDSDIGLNASSTPVVVTLGTTSGSARVVHA